MRWYTVAGARSLLKAVGTNLHTGRTIHSNKIFMILSDQSKNNQPMEQVLYEVKKIIVGQDHLLERMIVALLSRGHILVEGVPGLAKTMAIKTLAEVIGGEFKRIQFTPDLVPADLVGTRIYNRSQVNSTPRCPFHHLVGR
jgi:MoxR-like ATPase